MGESLGSFGHQICKRIMEEEKQKHIAQQMPKKASGLKRFNI